MWLITLGAAATLAVILYVPYVRAVFKFPFLHPNDLLVALALGLGSITWFEVLKSILRPNSDEMRTTTERGHVWYLKRIARIPIGWSFIVAGIAELFLPLLQGVATLSVGNRVNAQLNHKGNNSRCCWTASIECSLSSVFFGIDARSTLVSSTPISGRLSFGFRPSASS